MKFGSKKFPEFSPPFPSSQEFLQSKYSLGRISEVHWITLPEFVCISTRKLQRFNQIWSKLKSQYTAAITGSIQRGTKRSSTGSKHGHVHMIRKVGACYPDWIIKPMSAKGFVRYVTDNQWNWIINKIWGKIGKCRGKVQRVHMKRTTRTARIPAAYR